MSDLDTRYHETWIGLVQPSEGLVVSVPVLVEAAAMLRHGPALTESFRALLDGEGRFELRRVGEAVLGLTREFLDDAPEASVHLAEGQETVKPTFAVKDRSGRPIVLAWELPGVDLDKADTRAGAWAYPPMAKMERLLRHAGVPIGWLSNRSEVRLVYVPADESSGWIAFRADALRASGREVLDVERVSKSYGDKSVLRDVSLTVRRGEKIAVIGPNGLGKSTLLKIIMGRLAADEGTVRFGHEVRAGYFAQDHNELLPDPTKTPLNYLWDACPSEATTYVRGQLGRVLFSGPDVEKPIGALSGGEAARLIFGRIAVEKPNVLVLDEPTNHLDMEAIGALADGLREFDGTVLFVSHDRWFVSQLATRVVEVTPEGLRDFPGTYAEYLERCGDDHLDADAVLSKAKSASVPPRDKATAEGGLSWEEQKRRRNRLASLPARRDKVLASVEAAEARKKVIAHRWAETGFYERTPQDEIEALEREDRELGANVEKWLAEWEEIEKELARLATAP